MPFLAKKVDKSFTLLCSNALAKMSFDDQCGRLLF
jgi:hypothetical protein